MLEDEWCKTAQDFNSLFSKPQCPTGTELRDFQRIEVSLGFSESIGLMPFSEEAQESVHAEKPRLSSSKLGQQVLRRDAEFSVRHGKPLLCEGEDVERGRSSGEDGNLMIPQT